DLDQGAIAVPSDADDDVRVSALDPAVRFHVSVCRYAARGAVAGRGVAAHAFPATDPRDHAAWRAAVGDVAGGASAAGLHRGDDGIGDSAVSQAAGLSGDAAAGSPQRLWTGAW